MSCHIDGSSIVCSRVDGFARGSILRVPADADIDGKPWSVELLVREQARAQTFPTATWTEGSPEGSGKLADSSASRELPKVAWLEWIQSLAPGGGTKTLEEIVGCMRRRKVAVIGLTVVPSGMSRRVVRQQEIATASEDLERLVRFYARQEFVLDRDFPSWRPTSPPIMTRRLT